MFDAALKVLADMAVGDAKTAEVVGAAVACGDDLVRAGVLVRVAPVPLAQQVLAGPGRGVVAAAVTEAVEMLDQPDGMVYAVAGLSIAMTRVLTSELYGPLAGEKGRVLAVAGRVWLDDAAIAVLRIRPPGEDWYVSEHGGMLWMHTYGSSFPVAEGARRLASRR